MAMRPQTVALLQAARQLVHTLPADAVLLLTETDLEWDAVLEHLGPCRLLVAAAQGPQTRLLNDRPDLTVLEID
ncbi:MAG: DNA integrity scanning protein DisA nucleotide-binding domain protein, partial [Candidatus Acidiferrum sp.]